MAERLTESVSVAMFNVADSNFVFINKEWLANVKYKVNIDIMILEIIKDFQIPFPIHYLGNWKYLCKT